MTSAPTLILEENHDLPLCRVQLTTRTGAAGDPATASDYRPGLCNFATELQRRGAGGKTRAQIDEAIDALGASLGISCGRDSVTFEVMALKQNLDAALAILADVVLRPDYPEPEADKLRRELLAHLDDMRDDDGSLCWRYFMRELYGDHPLGRPISGTKESIERLDRQGALAVHKNLLTTGNVLLGVAGDLTEKEALSLWQRHFAELPQGPRRDEGQSPEPPDFSVPPQKKRLLLIDKPERTQSQILFGHFAPRWSDPNWLPLRVAATAFGGTFTARLMDEVRVKRGLSYGASCQTGAGRGRPLFHIHVFPSAQQTPETIELVLRLYQEWADGGITKEELDFARGFRAKNFAFRIETPEARLALRTELALAGVSGNYIAEFPERVLSVSMDEVHKAMATYLRKDGMLVTLVGTKSTLWQPLLEVETLQGASRKVVPYDSY